MFYSAIIHNQNLPIVLRPQFGCHAKLFFVRMAYCFCSLCALSLQAQGQTTLSEILSGTIVDATTNRPVAGAQIRLLKKDSSIIASAVSKADGKFTFSANNFSESGISESVQTAYSLVVRAFNYEPKSINLSELPQTTGNNQRSATAVIPLTSVLVKLPGVTIHGNDGNKQPSGSATRHITTLAGTELERARGQTFGDALKNVAGITLLQTGPSVAKPVIRGLHSQRVVVVNAGVVQEGQQWGAEHAPEIDPFAPAKIEVLRGAAGVEYGIGAIGGVVRVSPRELRTNAGFAGEATVSGFSNNWQGAVGGFVEGGFERDSPLNGFGWRGQASGRKAGDSRTHDYGIGNTGFHELNGALAVGYAGRTQAGRAFGLEAYYSLFTTELGIFRGSHIGNTNDLLRAIENGRPFVDYPFSYEIRAPKQQITHDLWSVRGNIELERVGTLEAQWGWQHNRRREFDAHNARVRDSANLVTLLNTRPAMTLDLTTMSLDLKLRQRAQEISLFNDKATLSGSIGTSGMWQNNIRTGRVFLIPDFTSWSAGIYANENLALSNGDVLLNAGARLDARSTHVSALDNREIPDTTHTFINATGAVGVIWFVGKQADDNALNTAEPAQKPLSVAFNLTSAWRPPLVNEQYSNDVHHGTAQFEIGDAQLKPERSHGAEVTLRYADTRLQAEVSGYWNVVNDFIFLFPDSKNPAVTIRGTFPTFRYRQANALVRGAEASLLWAAFQTAVSTWSVGATASLVRGNNLATNEPLLLMPADRARAFVRLEIRPQAAPGLDFFGSLGLSDVFVEVASTLVRRQDRFPANADYALPPAGYVLVDATLSGVWTLAALPVRWSVSVNNALNASYRDYLSRFRYFTDDAGTNVVMRVTVPFGSVQ